jgi:cholinesterase
MESGTTQVVPPLNTTTSEAMWYNITSSVGYGDSSTNSSTILTCMRTANSSKILAAVSSLPQSFTPTIDSVLVFNMSEYTARSSAGAFIKKPVLLGTTNNEASIFRIQELLEGQKVSPDFDEEVNLLRFTCPCAQRANVSVYNHVPTWRYRWFGVFPNTNLTTFPNSGAYHTSEIPIVFGTPPTGKGIGPSTSQELAISKYMRGAWATFAKDPEGGLRTYG